MLRITVQEDGTVWRLHLAGRLASVWVGETEQTWHAAQACGKQGEIDMREVTGIDEAGRCLPRAMKQAGARLVAKEWRWRLSLGRLQGSGLTGTDGHKGLLHRRDGGLTG